MSLVLVAQMAVQQSPLQAEQAILMLGQMVKQSATATNLAAGTYTVTVTSGTETATASATVSQPTQLVSTISAPNPISCAAPTSTITAGASGGTTPYTYSWSTGATTSAITTTLSGTYTVSVTDSKGCTSSKSATVTGSCVVACPTIYSSSCQC